jgi:uncharacterized membrane protein
MNPFKALLRSRKFWLAVMDAAVSTLAIVLAWWLSPDKVTQVLTLIGLWQPVVIVVIGAIAYEDGKAFDNQAHLSQYEPDGK